MAIGGARFKTPLGPVLLPHEAWGSEEESWKGFFPFVVLQGNVLVWTLPQVSGSKQSLEIRVGIESVEAWDVSLVLLNSGDTGQARALGVESLVEFTSIYQP